MPTFLCLIRPQNDPVAHRLSDWWDAAEPILKEVEIRDEGAGATREMVQRAMEGATAIFYFGHGTSTSLIGDGELVDFANVKCAKGAIIVAVACYSGGPLAREAVRTGTLGYIGFSHRMVSAIAYDSEFS